MGIKGKPKWGRWCPSQKCGKRVYHVATTNRKGIYKCSKCGEEFTLEQISDKYDTGIINIKKTNNRAHIMRKVIEVNNVKSNDDLWR